MIWQSCLGTVRRDAVMFGEAQRGSHGEVKHGAERCDVAGQSRRCKLWRGEVWRVLSGLDRAVEV